MSLTEIVKKGLKDIKYEITTPQTKEDMLDYLENVELKDVFKGLNDEDANQLRSKLEEKLGESIDKYSAHVGTLYQNLGAAGGLVATLADAYQALLAKVPLVGAQYVPLHNFMILAKAIPESVQMYKYFKASGDYKGILKWLAMKPVELAIPIVGPLLGTGYSKDIVRQRMIKEAKDNFLEEVGDKRTICDLDKQAKAVTGYDITPAYA